eukprot:CAMPEP_0196741516 /NCGR_PEP_ID=MMETSP1091-20130531/40791_1 /TAXON_ID=302021 /ORGANISM="Rhodomonas sp., Strain CCMP768" /LENGTH=287 /DNA_ID=CAMNT_0042087255 /DNA_START=24 /DNA_END=888 /DNA_ORIENTATION=+
MTVTRCSTHGSSRSVITKAKTTARKLQSKAAKSAHLSQFFKNYKCDEKELDPLHFCLLDTVASLLSPSASVLYPGCHRHVTPSLFFTRVTYVDSDAKLRPFFADEAMQAWVQQNKKFLAPAELQFSCQDFGKPFPAQIGAAGEFDLMISASAGIVSTLCCKYLKPRTGLLLVSDAHFDAKEAFLHPHLYEPVAFWDGQELQHDVSCLAAQFHVVTKGDRSKQARPITKEQLAECTAGRPRGKWSFKEKDARPMFFSSAAASSSACEEWGLLRWGGGRRVERAFVWLE